MGPDRGWRLALGLALVFQLTVLYLPQGVGGPQVTGADKVVHVLVFAVPALAALRVGIRARWALGLLAVHAPVSELIQQLALSSRSGDVLDVMADLGGILLGALVHLVWSRRQP